MSGKRTSSSRTICRNGAFPEDHRIAALRPSSSVRGGSSVPTAASASTPEGPALKYCAAVGRAQKSTHGRIVVRCCGAHEECIGAYGGRDIQVLNGKPGLLIWGYAWLLDVCHLGSKYGRLQIGINRMCLFLSAELIPTANVVFGISLE
jgi:hypothetical protein